MTAPRDIVIIGGGQMDLSLGYYLRRAGPGQCLDHRVGNSLLHLRPNDWKKVLTKLSDVDWRRKNAALGEAPGTKRNSIIGRGC